MRHAGCTGVGVAVNRNNELDVTITTLVNVQGPDLSEAKYVNEESSEARGGSVTRSSDMSLAFAASPSEAGILMGDATKGRSARKKIPSNKTLASVNGAG